MALAGDHLRMLTVDIRSFLVRQATQVVANNLEINHLLTRWEKTLRRGEDPWTPNHRFLESFG